MVIFVVYPGICWWLQDQYFLFLYFRFQNDEIAELNIFIFMQNKQYLMKMSFAGFEDEPKPGEQYTKNMLPRAVEFFFSFLYRQLVLLF